MWQVIAASAIGLGHQRSGLPCQDSFSWRAANDFVLAAVADGLGSAVKAEDGARIAAEAALNSLAQSLSVSIPGNPESWRAAVLGAFSQARRCLEEQAKEQEQPLSDYATTLIAAAFTQEWAVIGHIGDGAVVVLWNDDELTTISAPERGEYANEVLPLTSPDAMKGVRLTVRQTAGTSVKAVALLTDGLQPIAIDSASYDPFPQFFAPLLAGMTEPMDTAAVSMQLQAFLESERVYARTDDDKTLILIGRMNSERDPDDAPGEDAKPAREPAADQISEPAGEL